MVHLRLHKSRSERRELSSSSVSRAPVLIVDADGVWHNPLAINVALLHAESSGASHLNTCEYIIVQYYRERGVHQLVCYRVA